MEINRLMKGCKTASNDFIEILTNHISTLPKESVLIIRSIMLISLKTFYNDVLAFNNVISLIKISYNKYIFHKDNSIINHSYSPHDCRELVEYLHQLVSTPFEILIPTNHSSNTPYLNALVKQNTSQIVKKLLNMLDEPNELHPLKFSYYYSFRYILSNDYQILVPHPIQTQQKIEANEIYPSKKENFGLEPKHSLHSGQNG